MAEDPRSLADELVRAVEIADLTERYLEVAAIIQEALKGVARGVVVGGTAVAFWTGEPRTTDVDLLAPSSAQVEERLRGLGFAQEGRFWKFGDRMVVELPDTGLHPGDDARTVGLPSGRTVDILSPEDVFMWRLKEFVGTGHRDVARHLSSLWLSGTMDMTRLERRATDHGYLGALAIVSELAERQSRGDGPDPSELHEIAVALQKRLLSSEL